MAVAGPEWITLWVGKQATEKARLFWAYLFTIGIRQYPQDFRLQSLVLCFVIKLSILIVSTRIKLALYNFNHW